jgi:transposase
MTVICERDRGDLTRRHSAADKLADTEARMTDVLDGFKLTELATIPRPSAVGAAAILAETGDPNQLATARALVKHAGLAPREKTVRHVRRSDQAHRSGRTRPAFGRLAGVWSAQRGNDVYAARYQHLTTRQTNKLTATQAQTVIAAAILQ